MLNARIKLPNFDAEFNKNVKKEIQKYIYRNIQSVIPKIKTRIQANVKEAIELSPEYQAIMSGQLRGELGLVNPNVINAIIQTWINNINVIFEKNNSFGMIKIQIIKSDYSDVLTMPEASFIYNSNSGGGVIEWLRWLLLEGPSVIVFGYDFAPSNLGRTGLGLMVSRSGGGWSIDPQYAGTQEDNFVTRALSNIEKIIDNIVRQEVSKGL